MSGDAAIGPLQPATGRLRVGMIGAGDISRYHLRAWQKPRRLKSSRFATATSRARVHEPMSLPSPTWYVDAAHMFAHAELDVVDIATWRETHAQLTLLAAAHGVHVLCQKPLAPTFADAESLSASVADRVRLMVHENRRFAPHFRAIRRWIDEGRIGPVRQCVMTMHRSGFLKDAFGRRPAVERAPFMARENRLMIAETLIHQLDVLRFLLGPLSVVAARTFHTEPDMPGETLATILLEDSGGAPVVLPAASSRRVLALPFPIASRLSELMRASCSTRTASTYEEQTPSTSQWITRLRIRRASMPRSPTSWIACCPALRSRRARRTTCRRLDWWKTCTR